MLTPAELIEKLIALIPPPQANLLRYHGVFDPGSKFRKRATYMVKPSVEDNKLRGKTCTTFKWEDGLVELWCEGRRLPYSIFTKDGHVQQAAIVDNKRIAMVLEQVREKQELRDQERLASPKLTLRGKRLLREAAAKATEVPPKR